MITFVQKFTNPPSYVNWNNAMFAFIFHNDFR
jgi:hypothetical protein